MQFTFLDMAGKTKFIRDDAEQARWTQEEMTLEADFPYVADKVISTGQRVFFVDPSTGEQQIYEIKQAKTQEPDHFQSITAENICISELTDCFVERSEQYDVTASFAVSGVLNGTGWVLGVCDVNPVSSVKIDRGSVWKAILTIKDNFNVYIEPRVSLASNGIITRYLDIKSTNGVYNGLRLSVDKNFLDPAVIYDDSEVCTAMYGFGGTLTGESGETQKEVTFADVVWQATNAHPAKPAGQTFIEDKQATALYGRNGKARFSFYQNTNIDDPNVLIQKTWEALQTASKPAISIEGTVADLYRMGYADTPIKLHTVALVEVLPAGYKAQIQIIKMTTDLLDPSATSLTIGAYIPNIIYIQQENNQKATGSRGGGGNKSKQDEKSIYETEIAQSNRMIRLHAYELKNLDSKVKVNEASIKVQSDRITAEVVDRRNQNAVLSSAITQTATQIRTEVKNTADRLQSSITQTSDAITAEVTRATSAEGSLSGRITVNSNKVSLVVEEKDGQNVVKAASIVAGINSQEGSYVTIQASKINLSGYVTANQLSSTNAKINNLESGNTKATFLKAYSMSADSFTVNAGGSFTFRSYAAQWKLLEYKKADGTNGEMYVLGR